MLRVTVVSLKLISGIEKYQFIDSLIRSGISMISKWYAKAKNKFLKPSYVNTAISYIIYSDTHNLYGNHMMQLLQTEILHWTNPKDFSLDNCSNDSPIDWVLEVDLGYPNKLLDLHNDCPLTCE